MRSYESHVADAISIIDRDDEPVLVPTDVEDDTIVANDARVRVDTLYIRGRLPIRFPHIMVPGPQRLLGVGVLFPELTERTPSNDAHYESV